MQVGLRAGPILSVICLVLQPLPSVSLTRP